MIMFDLIGVVYKLGWGEWEVAKRIHNHNLTSRVPSNLFNHEKSVTKICLTKNHCMWPGSRMNKKEEQKNVFKRLFNLDVLKDRE